MPLRAKDPTSVPVVAPRKYKRYPHSDTEDGAMYQESISFKYVIIKLQSKFNRQYIL